MFPVAGPLTSGWHHGEFFHFMMLQYSLPGSGIVSRVHIFCSLQLWTWTPPLDLNDFYVVYQVSTVQCACNLVLGATPVLTVYLVQGATIHVLKATCICITNIYVCILPRQGNKFSMYIFGWKTVATREYFSTPVHCQNSSSHPLFQGM